MGCEVSCEELSRLSAGELAAERRAELEGHVAACARCREALDALREVEEALLSLARAEPPARAVLETRRAVTRELASDRPDVMTLDEAAQYLRVTRAGLEEAEGLPAFEIAGELRVRRSRLVEWIEERERAYVRSAADSDVARILVGDFGKGVA